MNESMYLKFILRFASTRILARLSASSHCERRVESYFVCTSDKAPWTNPAGSRSGDNAVDVLNIIHSSQLPVNDQKSYHMEGVCTFADYYSHS